MAMSGAVSRRPPAPDAPEADVQKGDVAFGERDVDAGEGELARDRLGLLVAALRRGLSSVDRGCHRRRLVDGYRREARRSDVAARPRPDSRRAADRTTVQRPESVDRERPDPAGSRPRGPSSRSRRRRACGWRASRGASKHYCGLRGRERRRARGDLENEQRCGDHRPSLVCNCRMIFTARSRHGVEKSSVASAAATWSAW
jgi:hypothetical protein